MPITRFSRSTTPADHDERFSLDQLGFPAASTISALLDGPRDWGAICQIEEPDGSVERRRAQVAAPPAQLRIPHGITGSRDGLNHLADRGNSRVQVFRQNGEFVREKILRPLCGAQDQATWVPKRPCGVEAAFSVGLSHDAPQTYLYVADGGPHVITVLRRSDLEVVDEFAGRRGSRSARQTPQPER
ncbi:MAG: hypothetical protein KA371_15815 [Acidobacteria bacterium]|nr:hypothetical protein [Acidobacteriota bacterium]